MERNGSTCSAQDCIKPVETQGYCRAHYARWRRINVTNSPFADLTGERFGALVVQHRVRDSRWLCVCDCGNKVKVATGNLNNGNSTTCGCSVVTHDESWPATPEYRVWGTIRWACADPTNKYYGGKGIAVCDEWQTYEGFIADVGRRPGPNYQFRRIDSDADFAPGNCVWRRVGRQSKKRGKRR